MSRHFAWSAQSQVLIDPTQPLGDPFLDAWDSPKEDIEDEYKEMGLSMQVEVDESLPSFKELKAGADTASAEAEGGMPSATKAS